MSVQHGYEVRPCKDIAEPILFPMRCRLVGSATNKSPMQSITRNIAASHRAAIRVYGDAGNVIQTHEHNRRFQRAVRIASTYRVSVSTTACTALPVAYRGLGVGENFSVFFFPPSSFPCPRTTGVGGLPSRTLAGAA